MYPNRRFSGELHVVAVATGALKKPLLVRAAVSVGPTSIGRSASCIAATIVALRHRVARISQCLGFFEDTSKERSESGEIAGNYASSGFDRRPDGDVR